MRILAFSRLKLAAPSAHAVVTLHTCAALARAGAEVTLHADAGGDRLEVILALYGIPAAPRLALRPMGWRWRSMALPLVAGSLLSKARGPSDVVFLNQVRPHALTLAAAARRAGLRVAFEAHNAAGRMAREAAGLPAEPAPRAASPQAPPEAPPAAHGAETGGGALLTIGRKRVEIVGQHALPEAHAAGAAEADEGGARPPAVPSPPTPDPAAEASARGREDLERAILARTDFLIATSRAALEALRDLARPGAPSLVVPNGTILPPPSAREKDLDILYCGSLSMWKGVDALVAAMPRLFPYRLTIVGGRDERDRMRLKEGARALGVFSRVTFLPPVKPSEVWDLYARAKVGVVPLSATFLEAREYTCPMKLLEMMAAGVPIVTVRLPSVMEHAREGQEVLMTEPDDPEGLAAAVRHLLEDRALAERLGAAARARAEGYSYDRRAASILGLLEGRSSAAAS